MTAILFGSIGSIADTSELQRAAFNQAFQDHGLDWNWDREEYAALLETGGGAQRIAAYSESIGQPADAAAIHRSKSELFQQRLADAELSPRPGVVETIREGKQQGMKVALVTTTSKENIAALTSALGSEFDATTFDLVVDVSQVDAPKPDRAAYDFALEALGAQANDCVAIEDNLGGVEAATAAGVRCVAFPGENNAGHDFAAADQRVERLGLAALVSIMANHGSDGGAA